jgi:hypothetical protein
MISRRHLYEYQKQSSVDYYEEHKRKYENDPGYKDEGPIYDLCMIVGIYVIDSREEIWFTCGGGHGGHALPGKVLKKTDDGFVWEWMKGCDDNKNINPITFKIVTLKRFNSYWRKKVRGVPENIQYDEDLHEWYRRYSDLWYGDNRPDNSEDVRVIA